MRTPPVPCVGAAASGTAASMEQDTGRSVEQADGLSDEELDEQHAAALPDREAMSTIGLDLTGIDNFAMPINEAVAINNQSVNSVAVADADQTVIIGQADTEVAVDEPCRRRADPRGARDATTPRRCPTARRCRLIPTSLLDLDVNVDAALDLAAPVDAGVAANANAALPIDAAVSANVLSPGRGVGRAGRAGLGHQPGPRRRRDRRPRPDVGHRPGRDRPPTRPTPTRRRHAGTDDAGTTPRRRRPMTMADDGLTPAELEAQDAAALPDREAMSLARSRSRGSTRRRCRRRAARPRRQRRPRRRRGRADQRRRGGEREHRGADRRRGEREHRCRRTPTRWPWRRRLGHHPGPRRRRDRRPRPDRRTSTRARSPSRRAAPTDGEHSVSTRAAVLAAVVALAGVRRAVRRGAGPGRARDEDNRAVATTEQDGGAVFDFAWSLVRQRGGVVDHATSRDAAARCTDCRATAIAFQIVLASGDAVARSARTTRRSPSTTECTSCVVYAGARQFVRIVDVPVTRFTRRRRATLADVRHDLRALEDQDLDADALTAAVEAQEARVLQVLDRRARHRGAASAAPRRPATTARPTTRLVTEPSAGMATETGRTPARAGRAPGTLPSRASPTASSCSASSRTRASRTRRISRAAPTGRSSSSPSCCTSSPRPPTASATTARSPTPCPSASAAASAPTTSASSSRRSCARSACSPPRTARARALRKADPLLGAEVPHRARARRGVQRLARVFGWLFSPLVLVAALGALVAFDVWLLFEHGVAGSLRAALYEPVVMLALFAAVIAATAWHEVGHATRLPLRRREARRPRRGHLPRLAGLLLRRHRRLPAQPARPAAHGPRRRLLQRAVLAGRSAAAFLAHGLRAARARHPRPAPDRPAAAASPRCASTATTSLSDLTGVPDILGRIKPILASLVPGRKPEPARRPSSSRGCARRGRDVRRAARARAARPARRCWCMSAPRIFATAYDSLGLQVDADRRRDRRRRGRRSPRSACCSSSRSCCRALAIALTASAARPPARRGSSAGRRAARRARRSPRPPRSRWPASRPGHGGPTATTSRSGRASAARSRRSRRR